eukprot:122222-Amphidinium_carterae.1
MLNSILNPGKASSLAAVSSPSFRVRLEEWEEQVRSYERKKDATGAEERLPDPTRMATLESMCPPAIELHLKLNHARLKNYDELRTEVLMLL